MATEPRLHRTDGPQLCNQPMTNSRPTTRQQKTTSSKNSAGPCRVYPQKRNRPQEISNTTTRKSARSEDSSLHNVPQLLSQAGPLLSQTGPLLSQTGPLFPQTGPFPYNMAYLVQSQVPQISQLPVSQHHSPVGHSPIGYMPGYMSQLQMPGYTSQIHMPSQRWQMGISTPTIDINHTKGVTVANSGSAGELRRARPRHWTQLEDDCLSAAVAKIGERGWKRIAENVPGRNHVQCLQRWKNVLDPHHVKGPWSQAEDTLLTSLVGTNGFMWKKISKCITGRNIKQCRERWCNYLDPSIKHGNWSADEDATIVDVQRRVGNRWATIAKDLPGRTYNQVKVRYHSLIRKYDAKLSFILRLAATPGLKH